MGVDPQWQKNVLARVGEKCADYMDDIKKLFVPGSKITVLVRHPSHPDGSRDFLMTDDTIAEAITALGQRQTADEQKLSLRAEV